MRTIRQYCHRFPPVHKPPRIIPHYSPLSDSLESSVHESLVLCTDFRGSIEIKASCHSVSFNQDSLIDYEAKRLAKSSQSMA